MASIAWPFETGRASKLLGDVTVQPLANLLESPMDSGRPKTRNVTTKCDYLATGIVVLDGQEYDTFLEWFTEQCRSGSQAFEWTHPITNVPCDMKFYGTTMPRFDVLVGNKDRLKIVWQATVQLRILTP